MQEQQNNGFINGLIDAYVAGKLTPEAMTRMVRQARSELMGISDEQIGEALSRIVTSWLKG